MKEIWLCFAENYEISNLGNIRNANTGNILKQTVSGGYAGVVVRINGKKVRLVTHRLVAERFIPNLENKPQVNHIDGNKLNNNANNLEWVTNKENIIHAIKHDLMNNSGEHNGNAKLAKEQIEYIRKSYKAYSRKNSYSALAKKFNISKTQVIQVVKNRSYI